MNARDHIAAIVFSRHLVFEDLETSAKNAVKAADALIAELEAPLASTAAQVARVRKALENEVTVRPLTSEEVEQ